MKRFFTFIFLLSVSILFSFSADISSLRQDAEQGDAEAQFVLASNYYFGAGVEKNLTESVKWLRKSAEQGYTLSQHILGFYYYNGYGIDKDPTEAVKWYRKAAEQGFAKAQYNLGFCYALGDGVEKDPTEAVKWYRKAAEQGFAKAQYALGVCYFKGYGIDKDPTEAVKWYYKAAEQGFAKAQSALAFCYYNGSGVEKNITGALYWYRKADIQGNADAREALKCHRRTAVLKRMVQEGKSEAQIADQEEEWKLQDITSDLNIAYSTDDPVKIREAINTAYANVRSSISDTNRRKDFLRNLAAASVKYGDGDYSLANKIFKDQYGEVMQSRRRSVPTHWMQRFILPEGVYSEAQKAKDFDEYKRYNPHGSFNDYESVANEIFRKK